MAETSEDDDTVGNIISQASPEITSKMMTEITETKQELRHKSFHKYLKRTLIK